MTATVSDKCGTYAGWNHHQRYNTEVCDPCRQAARDYQSQWRLKPEARAAHYLELRIEDRARRELAKRHQREYQRLKKKFKQQLAAADGA